MLSTCGVNAQHILCGCLAPNGAEGKLPMQMALCDRE